MKLDTGRDCETDIDECAGAPCRNGGECVDMIAKFKCICPVGYSGTLCEVCIYINVLALLLFYISIFRVKIFFFFLRFKNYC